MSDKTQISRFERFVENSVLPIFPEASATGVIWHEHSTTVEHGGIKVMSLCGNADLTKVELPKDLTAEATSEACQPCLWASNWPRRFEEAVALTTAAYRGGSDEFELEA